MPSSIDDIIRDLGAESGDSSTLELGIDDVRAVTQSLPASPEEKLLDLAAASWRNHTVTTLSCTVENCLADHFFRVANVLLRYLSRVTELQLTYVGPSFDRGATYDIGSVSAFLGRCFVGVTQLTLLSVRLRIQHGSAWEGAFDWKVLSPLRDLRSLELQNDAYLDMCDLPLEEMLRALSPLVCLQRVVFCGVSFEIESFGSGDKQLMETFIGRRSLETLHLENFYLYSGTALRSFVCGLQHSTIKHLHLSYCCNVAAESWLVLAAIATCRDFRTLYLDGNISFTSVGECRMPPLVFGATILRRNVRLTSLTFSNYLISDDEARNLSSELVQPSCALNKLDFAGCDVSYRGMGILLASQTSHTCMRDMRILRWNEDDSSGDLDDASQSLDAPMLVHIEEALRGLVDAPLRDLSVVDDYCPRFSRASSRAVVECLSGNYHLEAIEIEFLDEASQGVLNSIARLNAAGRRYLLSPCRSREAGVELLGRVSDNITDVFVHLSENPSLCGY